MLNRFRIFLIIPALLIAFACETEKTTEKSVQEIRLESTTDNAAIIRNPISASKPLDTVNVAKMEFEQEIFDFGSVSAGTQVQHTFKFKNTGKVPLLVNDARSTCGCTVPNWPKNLIPPGGRGEIKVQFNTTNMLNAQKKPVIITANTYPAETKVYLVGYVTESTATLN